MNAHMKFRPQDLPKSLRFKQRLNYGRSEPYHWQTRFQWYPAGWSQHQQQFARRFAQLHYRARHAPASVRKQWAAAYRLFQRQHFATEGKATVRYINTYTCHSWL